MGKTTYVAIALLAVLVAAVVRLNTDWMILLVVGVAAGLVLLYFVFTHRFATANPGAALLEGAELIRYKQVELAAKNLPLPPETRLTTDPTQVPPAPMLPEKVEPDQ